MQNTYELQADWIRRQYYRNLSFIDVMAKLYGESGFFMKGSLYAASTGLFFLVYINPIFLFVGGFLTSLLVILGRHYECVEYRLEELLKNMETTEIELNDLRKKTLALTVEADNAIKKNQECAHELEDTRIELNELQLKFNDSCKKANDSCAEIVESSEQVNKIKEVFSTSVGDVIIKIQDLVTEVDVITKTIKGVEPKLEEFSKSEGRLDELIQRSQNMHNHFLEKYSERFSEFKEKRANGLNQQRSFFSHSDEGKPDMNNELKLT